MRSEHNGGASLAAFLLAVSTMMLLFVSPVEGQVGDDCVVTAFPGEPGSCPATDSQGDALLCVSGQCQTCESAGATTPGLDCSSLFAGEDQIANCLRDCFGLYECTSNADCRDNRPTCVIATGLCLLECEVSAFPDAAGSCPDIPVEEVFAGPQLCTRIDAVSICVPCARFEEDFTATTAADCELLETADEQTADVVANCQRECFGFFACTTNADCPDTLPICNAGQCEISVFSPLDGMGGGSSA